MLKIRNLSKSFDGIKAVQNCSFDVDENSITALIGPNGAGKTTVFNLITGFIKPDKGVIKYKNNSIKNMQLYKISNLGITRTFQLIRLFPKLSITENLMLAEHLSGEKLFNTIFRPRMVRLDEKKKKKECLTYLDLVGLKDKAKVHAENLSYGQQKLVEIARVLATRSDLILLDEPVAGVNPTMREKIMKSNFKLLRF